MARRFTLSSRRLALLVAAAALAGAQAAMLVLAIARDRPDRALAPALCVVAAALVAFATLRAARA